MLELKDASHETINVYLWGELSNLELNQGDIVIVNGGRVSNFGGKSINCGSEYCKIIVNPTREIVPDIHKYIDIENINLVAKNKSQIIE